MWKVVWKVFWKAVRRAVVWAVAKAEWWARHLVFQSAETWGTNLVELSAVGSVA